MKHALIIVLSITSAAALAACAAPGEAENYKELEREEHGFERFHTEPATDTDPARDDDADDLLAALDPDTAEPTDPPIGEPTVPSDRPVAVRVVHPPARSLTGLERKNWPTIVFRPAEGRTLHQPTYYGQVPEGDDRISVLDPPLVPWQMTEALAGADAQNLSPENLFYAAWLPLRYGLNTGLLPVKAAIQPPWTTVYTPPTE